MASLASSVAPGVSLYELQDAHRALGAVDGGLGPAVAAGVVEDGGVEEARHLHVGRVGQPSLLGAGHPVGQVAGHLEERELDLFGRVELDGAEPVGSVPVEVAGVGLIDPADVVPADPGGLPGHVGQVELLPAGVGFIDGGAEGDGRQPVAQVADLVGVDRQVKAVTDPAVPLWCRARQLWQRQHSHLCLRITPQAWQSRQLSMR